MDTGSTPVEPISDRSSQDKNHPSTAARYEQAALNAKSRHFPDSSAATGNTRSATTRSHAPTTLDEVQSTYSYDSTRDLANYFREINGRRFSAMGSTYMLPFDEVEFGRLDRQHATMYVGLGTLYPCTDIVERVLASEPGVQKQLLDLGCGTGAWALAMARNFPCVEVVGVDIAPTPIAIEHVPENIRFELDDINQGLEHFKDQFDLVHMRCVGAGLPNYSQAITYAASCVKPGGILLIGEIDTNLCAEDMVSTLKMATLKQPNGSWLQRYRYVCLTGPKRLANNEPKEFRWANAVNGTDIFKAEEMLDHGLWDHPLLEHCAAGSMFSPIGPWVTSEDPDEANRLRFGGILQRQNQKIVNSAVHTVMRKNGVPQKLLDEWTKLSDAELDNLSYHSWIRYRMLWGIRKGGVAPPPSDPGTAWQPNRQVRVYHTREEAVAARRHKLSTIGDFEEPFVLTSDATEDAKIA